MKYHSWKTSSTGCWMIEFNDLCANELLTVQPAADVSDIWKSRTNVCVNKRGNKNQDASHKHYWLFRICICLLFDFISECFTVSWTFNTWFLRKCSFELLLWKNKVILKYFLWLMDPGLSSSLCYTLSLRLCFFGKMRRQRGQIIQREAPHL